MLDGGFPDYKNNVSIYNYLSIDQNALRLFQYWDFNDQNVLNVKTMKELSDISTKEKLHNLNFVVFIKELTELSKDKNVLIYYLILLISIILFLANNTKKWPVLFCSFFFVFVTILLCYMYKNCAFVYIKHVVKMIILSFITLCIYLSDITLSIDFQNNKILYIIIFLFIVCITSSDWIYPRLYSKDKTREELMETIENDKSHVYIKSTSDTLLEKMNFLSNIKIGSFDNIMTFGGWRTNYPLIEKNIEKYDIDNPYVDIVNNNKAYFLHDLDKAYNYDIVSRIEYYYTNVKIITVKKIGNYCISKITGTKK